MKKYLKIDRTDWYEQFVAEEPDVTSEEALIARAREGMSTTRIAQHAITARAEKVAPADILPADKLMLLSGGRAHISVMLACQKREVKLANGSTFNVREFVASVHDEEPDNGDGDSVLADEVPAFDNRGWIDSGDPLASKRAAQYLDRVVPGHIWNRLAIIAQNDGDVKEAASVLLGKVGDMIERLT